MLNIEKYKDEIINRYNGNRGTLSYVVAQILRDEEPVTYRKLLSGRKSFSLSVSEAIEWLASEYEEPVLNRKEMEYLTGVIKPFVGQIRSIRKAETGGREFIFIEFIGLVSSFCLPSFERGTMYKGMKLDKSYTPKELGICTLDKQQPDD